MQITLTPTAEIIEINGEPARVWRGTDDHGTPIIAHVRMVSPQTHDAAVNDRYARELREVGQVRGAPIAIDFRSII